MKTRVPPRSSRPSAAVPSSPARPSRRTVLRAGGALGVGILILPRASALGYAANERLDLGVVGVAGRGAANLAGVSSENVVALCDVDARNLAGAQKAHAAAKGFADFRRMLDEAKLDAVVVSTPDHLHAAVSAAALAAGKHVYCEKPLTHCVAEARHVTELAKKKGLATQMGTQIHAGSNYRRVVELVRSGAIGPVSEVFVVCGKSWGGDARPPAVEVVPDWLSWPLWLGPRQGEPYAEGYHPANWRRYWPFGSGTLGDMACHYMDLPFWALGLSHSEHVSTAGPAVDSFCAPKSLEVTWRFPATKSRGPVTLSWADGGRRPGPFIDLGLDDWGDGVLFQGEKGWLVANYDTWKLLPEERFADFQPPAHTIPDSIGHHAEWIAACKDGRPTTCNFGYSGPLSETVLLGDVAYRLGRALDWDSAKLAAPGVPEAEALVNEPRAEGWALAG